MKLIIDIDEDIITAIKENRIVPKQLYTLFDSVVNGTFISETSELPCDIYTEGYFKGYDDGVNNLVPDNATNGDVIKAMFPNTTFSMPYHQGLYDKIDISRSWWNAPYQKGGKE